MKEKKKYGKKIKNTIEKIKSNMHEILHFVIDAKK